MNALYLNVLVTFAESSISNTLQLFKNSSDELSILVTTLLITFIPLTAVLTYVVYHYFSVKKESNKDGI